MHLDLCGKKESVLIIIVSTQQGPELHLDVSTLQRPLLRLDISSKQRPELYLERVRRTVACAGLYMSILHTAHSIGPELHLHLSTLQRPLLHLYVSTPQGT